MLELWQRTRMDWGFVTDRLASTFRKETWIGAHERRFVGETLYGLVRHLRRVDLALTRGRKTQRAPRDLERLLALLVIEKQLDPARASRVEPDLDWRAVATVDDAIAKERDLTKRIALSCSLPDWLAARFVADWGDEAEALANSLNQRAPMTVRANLLVGTRDLAGRDLEAEGVTARAGTWSDTSLVVETRTNLFGLGTFRKGAIEVQDEGSQLLADIAAACVPAGKATVIDFCAGAGGKTLAIAARLGNRGRILAADVDGKKLEELRRRARRATVSNAQAVTISDNRWPPELDAMRGKADVVLVDAPCTGTGALRRNPEARWRLREADLATFAARQKEIVNAARHLCAPGGKLVYATCSLLRAENDEVVGELLSDGMLSSVSLRDVWGDRALDYGDGLGFTVAPHRHGTDGFFARILKV